MQEKRSSFACPYCCCLYLLLLSYSRLLLLISLACSDPQPPNLGGEGEESAAKVSNKS